MKLISLVLFALSTTTILVTGLQGQEVVKVDIYQVKKPQSVTYQYSYPARLGAYQSITVTSRVTGILQEKFYKEGSFVRKGTLLYRIEPNSYMAKVEESSAEVLLKNATLSNARREWERVEKLNKNSAVSQKEYYAALAAYEVAEADYHLAKARLKSSKIDLDYTRVSAPISGIMGMKTVDVGNIVNPGMSLVNMTQIDPVYAEFSVPDSDLVKSGTNLRQLAKKSALKVIFTYEGQNYSGNIDFIAPQINITNASVKMRARLNNPNNTLLPGAFGRISIVEVYSSPVIKVPQKAVLQSKSGSSLMVIEKGKALKRTIRLGKRSGDYFIVEQGLSEGDKVIVNNLFRIAQGTPVAIDKIVP